MQGAGGVVGAVDLALLEAGAQLGGGDVDQLDLVRHFEHSVGEGFGGADAGDAGDVVVEAFEVLDVEGGPEIDAGGDQFGDVLPALGVTEAGGVGVGELVDEQQGGAAGEGGIEVEVLEGLAAVGDALAGEDGESAELGLGFGAAVGFDEAGDDVFAGGPAAAGLG